MKEFIVWDRAISSFIDFESIPEFCRPSLEDNLVFAYIGLKDINDNKIYADCSIVEFESDCLDKNIRRYGFFTYNVEKLQYIISTRYITEDENIEWEISHKNLTNIKIIDTIQQNKLGLIK